MSRFSGILTVSQAHWKVPRSLKSPAVAFLAFWMRAPESLGIKWPEKSGFGMGDFSC